MQDITINRESFEAVSLWDGALEETSGLHLDEEEIQYVGSFKLVLNGE